MAQLPHPMTVHEFEQHTGRKPQQDDMERVNCQTVGQPSHQCCGWNHRSKRPFYEDSKE